MANANTRICPFCGHNRFSVSVHVVQTWIVDGDGYFEECSEECSEALTKPHDEDIWTCCRCSAEVTEGIRPLSQGEEADAKALDALIKKFYDKNMDVTSPDGRWEIIGSCDKKYADVRLNGVPKCELTNIIECGLPNISEDKPVAASSVSLYVKESRVTSLIRGRVALHCHEWEKSVAEEVKTNE